MAIPTPAEAASRWQRNLSASGQTITAGVNAVTEAPTQAALRNIDGYLMGVQNAVSSGKLQAGLQRATLDDWRRGMIDKGVGRISAGANAAAPKFQQFMSEFLPHVAAVQNRVKQMPAAGLEDRINRAVANMRGLAEFRRR